METAELESVLLLQRTAPYNDNGPSPSHSNIDS
jgi:hypothetical protein